MYENKVNGKALAGESLTGNLDFITIESNGTGGNNLLANFDRLVEVVSTRGQPVVLGTATTTEVKFANEHAEAWTKVTLEAALLAHAKITAEVTVSSEI